MNKEKNINRIDIKVKEINKVDFFIPACLEHALATYGETLGYDMNKAYIESWQFNIFAERNNGKKIGDFLKIENTLLEDMNTYNGIQIKYVYITSVKQLLEHIEKNISEGNPTLFHMDTYYSKWGKLYMKVHAEHIAIATGIDYANKALWIVDLGFSDKPFQIEFTLLEKATKFYLDICISNPEKYSYNNLFKMLKVKKNIFESRFDKIEKFASLFFAEFDPCVEFCDPYSIDCVLESSLIDKIRSVIKGRNMFIIFLEQLKKYYLNIDNVIELLTVSIGKWNTVMNILFKSSRTNWKPDINDKVYKIVMEIAKIEKNAFHLLITKSIEKRKICKKSDSLPKVCEEKKFVNVDISNFFNNKGFSNNPDEKKADLTLVGEYFVLNDKYKDIINNEVNFETYFDERQDNVICKGQHIVVNQSGKIVGLRLLLCAEWGTCNDAIVLETKDGRKKYCKIEANDISVLNKPETIVIGYSKIKDGNIVNSQASITYNCIEIDNVIDVCKIILPFNPNIHIIAICMELQG